MRTRFLRRPAALALLGMSAFIGACVASGPGAAALDDPPDTAGADSFFPDAAFDARCSYARPLRRGESIARYVERFAESRNGVLTDLDCFQRGQPDAAPPQGLTPRYYYVNSFLLMRQRYRTAAPSFDEMLRLSRLGETRPTGEILYFLGGLKLSDREFGCSVDLSMAAIRAGIWAGQRRVLYIGNSAVLGPIPPCTDPRVASLLSNSRSVED